MSDPSIIIRPTNSEDVPAINAIQNHYILGSVITFRTEPTTDDTVLKNFHKIKSDGLPYLTAVDNHNKVLGYSYVSSFRGVKPGYIHTVELSLFCHPEHVRKGIGKRLLDQIVTVLKEPEKFLDHVDGMRIVEHRVRQVIACMSIDVQGPKDGLGLREWYTRYGFEQRGHLKEVGYKMGRWIDTIYLQLKLYED